MKRKLYEGLLNRLSADTLEAYTLIEEVLANPTAVEDPLTVLVEQSKRLAQSEGALLTIKGYFDQKSDSAVEKGVLRNQDLERYQRLLQLVGGIEEHLRPPGEANAGITRVVDENMSPTFKRSQKALEKEEPDEE